MSTGGSLGQGMSTAIGAAWGQSVSGKRQLRFTWSSAMARPMKARSGKGPCSAETDHLIAFIDYNKKQLDGYTADICDIGDVRKEI